MHNRVLLFLSIVIFLVGCNSESANQSKKSAASQANNSEDSMTYDSMEYAFISKIIERGDTVFVDADYIQFLTGQAAIDAAIKEHNADTFKTEDGATHVDVPNDYYI